MKSYSLEVGDMAMKSTCLNMTIVPFADLAPISATFRFSQRASQLIPSHLNLSLLFFALLKILVVRLSLSVPKSHCLWVPCHSRGASSEHAAPR